MSKEAADQAPTDLYTQPGHLLRRAHQISASIFHDELGAKLTPIQYAVLRTLVEYPGVDQVTLAGLVAIDTSTAASVAIRLEEKKLLVRYLDPNNRRQRALYVTDAGQELLQSTVPGISRLHHRIFEGFSAQEQEQFMVLLNKLVQINNLKSRAPFSQPKPGSPEPAAEQPEI
ncbi:MAG TPA: MarR family winged helix-turn-helix transcriptional regulator [Pusillimonas sp.]|uniref:MarR family winged helix-turn-helix transcriptional regulator n=1 Tax=Pusillimonas sp. TaxID=3040095 RepID=UPI002CA8C60C|nr:MarR family winged helix-turn-helix transcriptional regulator [Pusillimonas sp.]HUH87122.1 MarR family winged helix-turn-helix transcriptional regulator [Pusillimonas sp.]